MPKNLCYHSHTFFCDGNDAPEKYIHSAIYLDLTDYGFSSHAPMKTAAKWSMKMDSLNDYSRSIDELKLKYKNHLNVYKSLEIDYIPGISYPFDMLREKAELDYTIGSIHLVKDPSGGNLWFIDGPVSGFDRDLHKIFNGDIQKAVSLYFRQSIEMIQTQKPDVLGHMDKILMNNKNRYFTIEDKWYRELVEMLLQTAKENNTIIEINTRGLYKKSWNNTFPGTYALEYIAKLNIPIVVSTDAHKPEEIMHHYKETKAGLIELGFNRQMQFTGNEWVAVAL